MGISIKTFTTVYYGGTQDLQMRVFLRYIPVHPGNVLHNQGWLIQTTR